MSVEATSLLSDSCAWTTQEQLLTTSANTLTPALTAHKIVLNNKGKLFYCVQVKCAAVFGIALPYLIVTVVTT